MTFNAMTEHYEEITVCGKPALFTSMPEFLTSDVLAQLTEAGILSSSIVKTLTLSTGHSKNVRLRSINRSFVNGYGRRDITTIST